MKAALHEFRERKSFFALVLLELVFAAVAVFSFLSIMGFNLFNVIETRKFSFALNIYSFDSVLFVLSAVLFAAVFFAVKKRFPELYRAQQKAFFEIKLSANEKVSHAKNDARPIALLFIEFFFVVMVFVSLSAFFDPQFELIPWSIAGIVAPTSTIFNIGIAAIVLYGFYWLYSKTADYREHRVYIKAKRLDKARH